MSGYIVAFLFGALVPTLLLLWEWRREEANQRKALCFQLQHLLYEIRQNCESRMKQMLKELTESRSPSYVLSVISRDSVWPDLLRSKDFLKNKELICQINDVYYEFEHINYKIRFIRDVLPTKDEKLIGTAGAGAIALLKLNLEDLHYVKRKTHCMKELSKIIDLLDLKAPFLSPFFRLVGSWRHFFAVLIAAFGTFVIFSPNFPPVSEWYNRQCPYFRALNEGLNSLSNFEFETSSNDYRQDEKTLEKDQQGFAEILEILRMVNRKKVDPLNVKQITNRRDGTIREGSGEYLDVLNLIHVYDPKVKPYYFLVTTENDLRLWVQMHRNRWIEGTGTAIVIIGIFWPYLWQFFVFLLDTSKALSIRIGKNSKNRSH